MFEYDDDSIKAGNGYIVMHRWETPIMKMMAEWACGNTGDILEVGYGMGICANFIQQNHITYHTIVECLILIQMRTYDITKKNYYGK